MAQTISEKLVLSTVNNPTSIFFHKENIFFLCGGEKHKGEQVFISSPYPQIETKHSTNFKRCTADHLYLLS